MRVRSLLLALAVLGSVVGIAPAQAAPPKPLEITMHTYRFCTAKTCQWTDQAYLAGPDGKPVGGQYNPAGKFPKVKPGQQVIFVYRDRGSQFTCDAYNYPGLNCIGHAPHVAGGKRIGFVPSRAGEKRITWIVPKNVKPGSRIPLYCDLQAHAAPLGMTYALDVVK